jgi:hypothetical protein
MLTDEEKVDGRRHMGYLNVQETATFVLGVPAAVQTQFVIEGALQKILAAAEPTFRRYINALNGIECQILDNQENLAAGKIGNIEVNLKEFEDLMKRYKFWQGQLSNLLGVPPNPFDARPGFGSGATAGNGINVPVIT